MIIYVYLFICVRKILIQLFDNDNIDGAWNLIYFNAFIQ